MQSKVTITREEETADERKKPTHHTHTHTKRKRKKVINSDFCKLFTIPSLEGSGGRKEQNKNE